MPVKDLNSIRENSNGKRLQITSNDFSRCENNDAMWRQRQKCEASVATVIQLSAVR